jgi:hypothetical protein
MDRTVAKAVCEMGVRQSRTGRALSVSPFLYLAVLFVEVCS